MEQDKNDGKKEQLRDCYNRVRISGTTVRANAHALQIKQKYNNFFNKTWIMSYRHLTPKQTSPNEMFFKEFYF